MDVFKPTMLSVSMLIVVSVFILLVPSEADAEENEAVIKVVCNGPYWGTIKGYWEDGIEAVGEREFTMRGDIIYVIMNKADDSDWEMTVSIIVDGNVRVTDSTSQPEGEIRLSYSFGEILDDDDDGDDDGPKNRVCTTSMVGVGALLVIGVLSVSGTNRRK